MSPYVRREYPEWSWSHSRKGTFDACRRMYFYQYYGAHNGWERDADEFTRRVYRLKKLTNLYMLLGTALHDAAAKAVRSAVDDRPLPAEVLDEMVRRELRQGWRESRDDEERWKARPNRYTMLQEFYYDGGPPQELIDTVNVRIERCIPNILASKSYREAVTRPPEDVAQVENMDTFQIFATKVYAVPDLVYRDGGGQWVIVDWKTGGENDAHADQLKTYGLYMREKKGISPQSVRCRVEYLTDGRHVEFSLSQSDLKDAEAEIAQSLDAMRSHLRDTALNAPEPRASFPLRGDTATCRFCKFFELCQDEINANSAKTYSA